MRVRGLRARENRVHDPGGAGVVHVRLCFMSGLTDSRPGFALVVSALRACRQSANRPPRAEGPAQPLPFRHDRPANRNMHPAGVAESPRF